MRILHLYSGNLYGGIERVLVTLARTPVPQLQHHFALFFDGRLAAELREAGASVDLLGPAALTRPWGIARSRRVLARVLPRVRPDVVLAHSPWALAVAGRSLRTAGRVALWLHSVPSHRLWPDRAGLHRHPDIVLANSRLTAAAAAGALHVDGWLYPPVQPPAPGIPASRERVRRELGALPTDVVILQASRIERGKGLVEHIDALGLLADVGGWVAWVAGAPQRRSERPYFDQLRAHAASAGIADRVRFLGHRSDIPELMAAADVYCQPNVEPEPFGVALVEALAAGRCVVTTAGAGLAEALEPAGRLVAPENAAALAATLRELVLTPSLRQELGDAGPALARSLCDPRQQALRLGELLTGDPVHAVQ